jgi:hypothetical protein
MAKQRRKAIPLDIRMRVLHEAGYRCAIPACRMVLTLDIHHMVYVSEGGPDKPENLLALCGNCHALHHMGKIPRESIRAWKLLLMALNEAFDRRTIDLLLALQHTGNWLLSAGDALPDYAPLIVSGLAEVQVLLGAPVEPNFGKMRVYLSDKGRSFIEAWKRGDQAAAVNWLPQPTPTGTAVPDDAGTGPPDPSQ